MTAPALTPTEQAEVDRFGMHDEEVIADLERNQDEEPGCQVARCDDTATHALVCRSCRRQCGVVCDPHAARIRISDAVITHLGCGAEDRLLELIEVVPM